MRKSVCIYNNAIAIMTEPRVALIIDIASTASSKSPESNESARPKGANEEKHLTMAATWYVVKTAHLPVYQTKHTAP